MTQTRSVLNFKFFKINIQIPGCQFEIGSVLLCPHICNILLVLMKVKKTLRFSPYNGVQNAILSAI